jgi:glyoxylase-like metal-dependent hydrolase (beta-lactamase superfamily II)
VREVVPGLVHLDLRVTSAYLIVDAELTLVDAGMRRGAERILRTIRDLGRAPGDVATIVATHHHTDHVGGLARVVAATGAAVAVHAADAQRVETGGRRPTPRGTGVLAPVMAVAGPFVRQTSDPVRIDRELRDGDVVAGLRVVHTPGHTPGHISLVWEPRGVLFVGDAFSNMLRRVRHGFVLDDLEAAKSSIARIAGLEFDVAVFGHGDPIVGDAALRLRDSLERLAR